MQCYPLKRPGVPNQKMQTHEAQPDISRSLNKYTLNRFGIYALKNVFFFALLMFSRNTKRNTAKCSVNNVYYVNHILKEKKANAFEKGID